MNRKYVTLFCRCWQELYLSSSGTVINAAGCRTIDANERQQTFAFNSTNLKPII